MAKFALLLPHAPDRYTGMKESDYMGIIKDYVVWTEKLSAKGIYETGHKLADDLGRELVRTASTVEVLHTSATEVAEVLGGLMIIKARDYDEAVEIAKTCPHLVHNEKITVRQIAEVDAG